MGTVTTVTTYDQSRRLERRRLPQRRHVSQTHRPEARGHDDRRPHHYQDEHLQPGTSSCRCLAASGQAGSSLPRRKLRRRRGPGTSIVHLRRNRCHGSLGSGHPRDPRARWRVARGGPGTPAEMPSLGTITDTQGGVPRPACRSPSPIRRRALHARSVTEGDGRATGLRASSLAATT